ncbi:DUF1353 domain-containing protein [Ekhidna sp.]|uniref:DUF1353 domain-containing protein n=1 Tax=Ekhidna sp. TaxID=2608089 RepID=UPI003299D0A4
MEREFEEINTDWKNTPENEGGCLKPGAKKLWKFVHHDDFKYQTDVLLGRKFVGKWLKIDPDGTITVHGSQDNHRGYAWDGCTPKFNFLQITWGNFDGQLHEHTYQLPRKDKFKPRTYYASMIHDILYQYKRCVPVTRKEADRIFYNQLKEAKWIWVGMYWLGVRLFGWIYSGWKYK